MFINHVRIKVSGKNINYFIKYLYKKNINFRSLDIHNKYFYADILYSDYKKITSIKTIYDIKIEKVYGFSYLKELLFSNFFFLFSFIFSIFLIYLLSFFIFDIVIFNDDKELVNDIYNYLEQYNIKKNSFRKSYSYISEVKNNIISDTSNNIDWIEIDRVGSKYFIRVEKRIQNDISLDTPIRHVVAKKNGIIKKIYSSKGEVVKKINDYVSKGDVIISGEIHKKDDVLDNVSASGNIYAEVWYNVKVTIPYNYYEKKILNNKNKSISFKFINNNFTIFKNNFFNYNSKSYNIYSDFFDLFSINYNIEQELFINDSLNTITCEAFAVNYAREKLSEQLSKGEYIISQKKLKTIQNDSTILVEVFFKVYEDISEYKVYRIDKGT